MTEKLSIAITAVEGRELDAYVLQASAEQEGLPKPEVIVWTGEVGYKGMVANERRAFEYMSAQDVEWCLLLHDDCICAKDVGLKVQNRLEEAVERKADVVSFFSMSEVPPSALDGHGDWYTKPGIKFRFEQALCMRRKVADQFVAFSWKHGHEYRHTDMLLADFFQSLKLKVHYPLPNLFDHRLDMPSTVGHGATIWGKPRNSRSFEGA